MGALFSDRYWILKLALAAGLLAALCHRSRREFSELNPNYRKVPVHFEKLRGRTVHLWAKTVAATAPDGFDVETDVGLFRVISPDRPPVGEQVSVVARVAGPRTLEAAAVQRNEGNRWKRPLMYAASLATLAVFFMWARRRFRWPLREGLFRSRA